MQIFYYKSNFLMTFQSYIYHQVINLAYKILIKNICIINTPYGNKTRGSDEQYNDAKATNMIRLKR